MVHRAALGDGEPSGVALKDPLDSDTLTRKTVDEFRTRAGTWRSIDTREQPKRRWEGNEHVVTVVDVGDQFPWTVTEYMNRGSFGDRLGDDPDSLALAEALWLGERICRGFKVTHSLGIARLDLKPENVLLSETEEGLWDWPKIAEWGIARSLADHTGTIEGLSVSYAAPEQFDAGRFGNSDQLTDVYQLGVLVYALLTGDPPTTGSQFEVMSSVMDDGEAPPPSTRHEQLPLAVDAAVAVALEREKTDRYDSVTTFARTMAADPYRRTAPVARRRATQVDVAVPRSRTRVTRQPRDLWVDRDVVQNQSTNSLIVS